MTHSFPTRRSSDLPRWRYTPANCWNCAATSISASSQRLREILPSPKKREVVATQPSCRLSRSIARSEEHTSDLQQLMRISYAVFCLKKNTYANKTQQPTVDSVDNMDADKSP